MSEPNNKPWTVKNISDGDRNAAKAAAGRADVTLGEWVGRAIRTQVQVDLQADRAADTAGFASDLADAERLIAMAKELGPGERPPTEVTNLLWELLTDRLKAEKGRSST